MFSIKTLLAGIALGGTTALFSMQCHVINTADGLIVLPRSNRPPFRSAYVDVRKWSIEMWRQHPEVAEAAIKCGRPDLVAKGALNSLFPDQAANSAEPTTVQHKSQKLAMESLVPIRFSTPIDEANAPAVDAITESPAAAKDTPIFPNFDFGTKASQSDPAQDIRVPEPATNQFSRNLFEPDSQSGSSKDNSHTAGYSPLTPDVSKLPALQNPVPIFEGQSNLSPSNERIVRDYSQRVEEAKDGDWFDGLVKTLIPQNGQAAASPHSHHSAAHTPFPMEAPTPHSSPEARPESSQSQQNFQIPMVRPF